MSQFFVNSSGGGSGVFIQTDIADEDSAITPGTATPNGSGVLEFLGRETSLNNDKGEG